MDEQDKAPSKGVTFKQPQGPVRTASDAVQLISEGERLSYTTGSSTFYYRRLTAKVRNRLAQKYSRRGETDWGKYLSAAMRWGVLGWENVRDVDQNLVEFDPRLLDFLPAEIVLELQDLMGARAAEEDDLLGN